MNSFFSALFSPGASFVRNALFAGLLSSILFGMLGTVVTVRRIGGLAGAVSHAVLGGIGLALFLSRRGIVPGLPPMAGALAFALGAALVIGVVSLKAKQREDTVINAIWAVGMGLGILFMARTPGTVDPMSYLFGSILLVTGADLVFLAVLDAVVLVLFIFFHRQIEAWAFDEEFARIRGLPTTAIFLCSLAVIALAIVLLQGFVGLIMVIAMLSLPAGTAAYRARSLAGMMASATILSALYSSSGLALSWALDLPTGAVVVVLAGIVYLGAAALTALHGRTKGPKKGILRS